MRTVHDRDGAPAPGRQPLPELVVLPLDTLQPHPGNARRGDVELLAESLRAHGQYAPLIAQSSTRHVLRGNHLLAAMKKLGWTQGTVQLVDVDDDEAQRILLIDNRASDHSSYDVEKLLEQLESLPTLDGTGYDEHDLSQLLESLDADRDDADHGRALDGILDDDEDDGAGSRRRRDAELPLGAVVALGEHRIACADPRDPHAWTRLLETASADLLLIDATAVHERALAEQPELIRDTLVAAEPHLAAGAAVLLVRHADSRGLAELVAVNERFALVQELVHLHEPVGAGPFAHAHTQLALAQKPSVPAQPLRNRTRLSSVCSSPSILAELPAALTDAGAVVVSCYPTDAAVLVACEQGGQVAHLIQPDAAVLAAIIDAWREAGGEPPRRLG